MSTYSLSQQQFRAPVAVRSRVNSHSTPSWGHRGSRTATHLRLTRRGKLVISTLVLAVVAVFFLLGVNAVVGSTFEPTQTVNYTVSSGDSLWGLASTIAQPGQDIRDVVHAIQQLNGLDSADIFVGQQLSVPVA